MQPAKYSRKTGQVKSFAALGGNFPDLGSLPEIRISTEFFFSSSHESYLSFYIAYAYMLWSTPYLSWVFLLYRLLSVVLSELFCFHVGNQ